MPAPNSWHTPAQPDHLFSGYTADKNYSDKINRGGLRPARVQCRCNFQFKEGVAAMTANFSSDGLPRNQSKRKIELLPAPRRRRRIHVRQIHLLPLPRHNPRSNLSGTLPQLRLLVAIHSFLLAHIADRPVVIPKTIQQTRMSHLAIATAIARLLVKHWLHLRSQRINFLRSHIRKLFRIERPRQRSGRRRRVVRRSIRVRPGSRRRLRERQIRTRPRPTMRVPDSKPSPSHQNHPSKYKSRLPHLAPPQTNRITPPVVQALLPVL